MSLLATRSTRDIEATVKENYGVELSEGSIYNITKAFVENFKEWQQQPLEEVFFVIWMDGILIKIRYNGMIQGKTIYLIIGLSKDYLIACTENLADIRQAINAVFPGAITQLCVVHQIRNSSCYVVWKERKQFIADLKLVNVAINKKVAYDALQEFEKKWGSKYGCAIKSCKENWEELFAYFDFPMEIWKIIYTINAIESLNSSISKYTKSKTLFPDDQSAMKAVHLVKRISNRSVP